MDDSKILLPDGTYVVIPVTPLPTKEVEEEESKPSKDGKGFELLEKARTGTGSTAAAGSDFFHIYRRMRANELARLEKIDQDASEAIQEEAFFQRRETRIREALEKTAKKAAKRQRRKDRRRVRAGLKSEA